jgi:alpha-beta hydrolase superfamily lysophospholipase
MKKWLRWIGTFLLALFVFINLIAIFHAYKLTHFYDTKDVPYKSPLTMTGWEKTKVILFGVYFPKKAITTTPAHAYETFHVTTTDNVNLEGWYIPKTGAKGTVLLFHGHGGNRSGEVNEANAFYNFGYNVCMIDFRAHGNSSENVCTVGYKEAADVKATYNFVVAKGEKNIILWGVSLGASTIARAMYEYPAIKPTKVILEMPFGKLSDAVEGRLRMMHLPPQPLATILTFWGGVEQGFWAFDLNPSEYVKSVHVPVLLQWGKHDIRVTEAETQTIYKNLGTNQKRLVIYNESGHQSLLNNEPEKWTKTVQSFLQ